MEKSRVKVTPSFFEKVLKDIIVVAVIAVAVFVSVEDIVPTTDMTSIKIVSSIK